MSAEELMAAVNAGISQANGSTGGTPDVSSSATPAGDSSGEASVGSEPTGNDDDSSGEGAPEGADGAGEAATAAGDDTSADGDAPAGDGEDSADEGDKPAAEAGGQKAEAPALVDGGKKPDPLNDPLPNALKRETKERITTLVGMVKEKTAKLEQVTAEHNEVMGYIQETRATPQQYGQALTYLKLVNSPDRADKEAALEIMQQEIAVLARMIGKPVPGVNMLEGHDDLISEVGAGRLSMERAAEIAAHRESQNFQQRQTAGQRQQQEETQALARARQTAVNQLNALEQSLKSDPAYAIKRPVLIAQLRPVFARLHPSHWPAAFKEAYDAMPANVIARQPTPTHAPSKVPANTPLRAANPAGGASPAPKTMAEAIELGLKQAR